MAYQPEDRVQLWERDGLFVVPQRIAAARVADLTEACDHVLKQVREESAGTGHSTTHITGLLAPHYYAQRPDLLERLITFASSRAVIELIHDLGLPREGDLNLRSAHYFHEPTARDYDGEWHRDGDEVQLPKLDSEGRPALRSTSLRFRVALAQDDHLEIVPGSHRRDDTPEELRLRRGHVRNAATAAGAVRIELEPGDVCVFDTWTIHRGRYRRRATRRTLDLVFGFGMRRSSFVESLRDWRALAGDRQVR
jgi:ectoine hydroxylase-related dioxygenase (phytanoyl-CoA dioxygenase family)